MSDDLLHTLGAQARDQRCDPWRAVVEGRATAAEVAALDDGPVEVIEASVVLFEPTPAATRDAVLDAVLAEAGRGSGVVELAAMRPRKRGWMVVGGAIAAAAAAILLVVLLPDRGSDVPPEETPIAALGIEYDLELSGGFAKVRGDEPKTAAPLELALGSELRLVLRPEVDLPRGRSADLVVFALGAGEPRTLAVTPERAANGTMVIAGPVDEVLALPPGEWTLVVVVGPKGHLPSSPAAVAEGAKIEPHWQVLRRIVRIVDAR